MNNINAQSIVQFPFSNSEWIYSQYDFNCTGPGNYCGTISYKFNGDTVIQGFNYNKLTARYFQDTSYQYVCGIRQDSITGNINLIFQNNCGQIDTQLFSFNYNVQDTIKICDQILGEPFTIIDNIDSIFVLGEWRKRITLLNTTSSSYIEGIGSTYGFIGPWAGWIGGYTILDCFLMNGHAVYPSTSCGLNKVYGLSYQLPYTIKVDNEITQIKFNRNIHQPIEITLINIEGKKILTKIHSYALNGISYDLDISDIKTGIYFLCIEIGNEKNVSKLPIIK